MYQIWYKELFNVRYKSEKEQRLFCIICWSSNSAGKPICPRKKEREQARINK